MKRLILLSTASALRGLARLPVSAARKLADAADWLEERAQTWHPVMDAEMCFRIVSCNLQFNEADPDERAKIDRLCDLYIRLLNELVFFEPTENISFRSYTHTLKVPPFQLRPDLKDQIASGAVSIANINLKPELLLIHNFYSEAHKVMGSGK